MTLAQLQTPMRLVRLAKRSGARVKKLAIVVLLVFTACHRKVTVTSAPTATVDANAGAATARDALQKFMAAGKAQDLQAMAEIWGSKSGSARANMDRET